MKAGVLYSGGKDSTYAMHLAKDKGWELKCLITIESKNPASYMFHTPNIRFAEKQAECLGLPLLYSFTEGEKEEELKDLKAALKDAKDKFDVDVIVTGAVASKYQKDRVEQLCKELGLECFSPLWGKDQEALLIEMIERGMIIKIIAIAAHGLDESYLGKTYDKELLEEMRKKYENYGLHIAGEGGEFESFIVDCPLFKKRIEILDTENIMENECTGFMKINNVELSEK